MSISLTDGICYADLPTERQTPQAEAHFSTVRSCRQNLPGGGPGMGRLLLVVMVSLAVGGCAGSKP